MAPVETLTSQIFGCEKQSLKTLKKKTAEILLGGTIKVFKRKIK